MTQQEQKAAVERAAEENGWVAVFSFTKGAEHVIDNPSDFGLVEKRLVDAGIQLRIETVKTCEETHLQNEKYREALEEIAERNHSDERHSKLAVETFKMIAKEALKQQ